MTKLILQYLLPLILPTLVYLLWAWLARPRGSKPSLNESLRQGPWFWLITSGISLCVAVLVLTAVYSGDQPGGVYHPPTLQDGGVVPGRFEEPKQ